MQQSCPVFNLTLRILKVETLAWASFKKIPREASIIGKVNTPQAIAIGRLGVA